MGVWTPSGVPTSGNDTFVGGDWAEQPDGGDGDDTIFGNGGNDTIVGGAGNDVLDGGDGDDYISDLAGVSTTITGGNGDDRIIINGTIVSGTINGGAGASDRLTFYNTVAAGVNLTGITITNVEILDAVGQIVTARPDQFAAFSIISGANKFIMSESGAMDLLSALGNDDVIIEGANGADVIGASNGNDTVYGFDGDDRLYGYGGLDVLYGGEGSDIIDGGAGNDTIIGGAGNDTISGGDDSDVINDGAGNDTVTGGAGNDRILAGGGSDSFDGGSGQDTFDFGGIALGPTTVNLTLTTAQLVGDGSVFVLNFENIQGSGFNDTLIGTSGANELDGRGGADTMIGGAGDDIYNVDNIADVVTENPGEGIDSIVSSVSLTLPDNVENATINGSQNIVGNALNNVITAASNAPGTDNTLDGRAGNDTLVGGAGFDVLIGGTGADTMIGGRDNDTYYVDDAGDVIVEENLGNSGIDLVYSTINHNLQSNVEHLTLQDVSTARNAGGNALNNIMTGNSFANGMSGAAGNDTLYGLGGDDTLFGDGADSLYGGTGNDVYVVSSNFANVIELAGEGYDWVFTSTSYNMTGNVEGMVLDANAGAINAGGNALDNYIQGNDADNGLDGGPGTDTLVGGGGNDTLFGGGLDNLIGGTGNDVYIVDNPGTNITELAGEGYDWIFTTTSFTMQANVDGMVLQEAGGAINAAGNGLNNYIQGNSFGNGIDGGAGADTLVGFGGNDTFVFQAGQANGDVITDFIGNGAAAGDRLVFQGYGTAAQGATFTQINATQWSVNSADGLIHDIITLSNGATLDPSDYLFG